MTDSAFPQSTGHPRLAVFFERAWLPLLVVAAFILRLWGFSHMHYWDENVYLQNAELICCGKSNYNEIDSRPPLLSILFAGAFKLWNSDYAAWIVTALVNALAPAFLYLGGRKIAGKVPAALAALLLAFMPFFVGIFPDGSGGFVRDFSGHSLLADCPALTCIVLAFWLLMRALESKSAKQTAFRFALAGFALALAVLMRFGSLSSVGMLALLVLAANRRGRAALFCALGFTLGFGPYLLWSRIAYGGYLETIRNGWENFYGPGESPFFFVINSAAIFSWIALAGLALWLLRFVWESWIQKDTANRLIAVQGFLGRDSRLWDAYLWLWALAILVFFSSFHHKELRYIIPLAPPVFLLAGIGLAALLHFRQTALRIAGEFVLAAALAFTFWPLHHCFDTGFIDHSISEEMEVSSWLTHSVPPSTLLYTNMNYPDFAWYTNFHVEPIPESGPNLYQELQHLPENAILIAYKQQDDGSPIEPPLAWLDANLQFHRFQEFPDIVLYQYSAGTTPSAH